MYVIEFSQLAEKQLYKLPKEVQLRVVASLERCRIRPYPHVKKLVGSNYFSLRVGDYRVIMDVQENKLIIFIIELGHRKKIYKL